MASNFNESTSPVQSGGAASINIDLATLTSIISNVATTIARQVMVVGDANNANAVASIDRTSPTGGEYAVTVRLAPSPDLQALLASTEALRVELQNLVQLWGGVPMTSPPIINNSLS